MSEGQSEIRISPRKLEDFSLLWLNPDVSQSRTLKKGRNIGRMGGWEKVQKKFIKTGSAPSKTQL